MVVKGFTARHKLTAIEGRYYNGGFVKWEPKVGDLYTIIRNDLEVFVIAKQDGDNFVIEGCMEGWSGNMRFPVKGFSTEEFGPNRVYLPSWVVEQLETTE